MKTNFNPQRVTIHGNHPDLSWYDNCREAYYIYLYERNMLKKSVAAARTVKNTQNKACVLFAAKAQASPCYNWALWDAWSTACHSWEKSRDTVYELQDELAALKPRTEPSWSPPLFTWGPRIHKRPARGACARAALREQLEAEPTEEEVRDWDNTIWYLRQLLAEYEDDRGHYARKAALYRTAGMAEHVWKCYSILFGLKLKSEEVRAKLDRLLLVGP